MIDKGKKGDQGEPGEAPAAGAPPIDPTKNVLDLVKAESKYQDAMRDSLKEKLDESHGALKEQIKLTNEFMVLFQNAQRDSETRRIDQLASTRQEFSNTIRDMLAESVRTTSTLVSTQLVQIQATFDTRVSKLEAFQFTQAGRSSVSDPATADAMTRMSSSIAGLSTTTGEAMNKISNSNAEAIAKLTDGIAALGSTERETKGRGMGRGEVFAWLSAAVVAGGVVVGLIGALFRLLTTAH